MVGEQSYGEAIHAEGDAAGVRVFVALVVQPPHFAEMCLVIVEAHAGGGLRAGVGGNEKLEFPGVVYLAYRHHLPHPTEEGITSHVQRIGKSELIRESLGM